MNIHWWSTLSGHSISVSNGTLWTSFCAACGSWSQTACVPWICGHSLSHSCWSCSSCVCPCWSPFLLSQSNNACCHVITAISAIQWCPPILMSASPVGMLVCSKIVPQRQLSHPQWSWSQPRLAWLSHRSCNVLSHVALSCIGVCCQIDCSPSQSSFTSCLLAFVFSPNLMRVLQKMTKICCCFWCRHWLQVHQSKMCPWQLLHLIGQCWAQDWGTWMSSSEALLWALSHIESSSRTSSWWSRQVAKQNADDTFHNQAPFSPQHGDAWCQQLILWDAQSKMSFAVLAQHHEMAPHGHLVLLLHGNCRRNHGCPQCDQPCSIDGTDHNGQRHCGKDLVPQHWHDWTSFLPLPIQDQEQMDPIPWDLSWQHGEVHPIRCPWTDVSTCERGLGRCWVEWKDHQVSWFAAVHQCTKVSHWRRACAIPSDLVNVSTCPSQCMHDCRTKRWPHHDLYWSHLQPMQVGCQPSHGCWHCECSPHGVSTQSDAHLHHRCLHLILDRQENSGSCIQMLTGKLRRWHSHWLGNSTSHSQTWPLIHWSLGASFHWIWQNSSMMMVISPCLMTMHDAHHLVVPPSAWSSWQEQEKDHHWKLQSQPKSQIGLLRQWKAMRHAGWPTECAPEQTCLPGLSSCHWRLTVHEHLLTADHENEHVAKNSKNWRGWPIASFDRAWSPCSHQKVDPKSAWSHRPTDATCLSPSAHAEMPETHRVSARGHHQQGPVPVNHVCWHQCGMQTHRVAVDDPDHEHRRTGCVKQPKKECCCATLEIGCHMLGLHSQPTKGTDHRLRPCRCWPATDLLCPVRSQCLIWKDGILQERKLHSVIELRACHFSAEANLIHPVQDKCSCGTLPATVSPSNIHDAGENVTGLELRISRLLVMVNELLANSLSIRRSFSISDKTFTLVSENGLHENIAHELLLFLKQVNPVLVTPRVTHWVKHMAEALCGCFGLEFTVVSIPQLRFLQFRKSWSIPTNPLSECANIIRSFVRSCTLGSCCRHDSWMVCNQDWCKILQPHSVWQSSSPWWDHPSSNESGCTVARCRHKTWSTETGQPCSCCSSRQWRSSMSSGNKARMASGVETPACSSAFCKGLFFSNLIRVMTTWATSFFSLFAAPMTERMHCKGFNESAQAVPHLLQRDQMACRCEPQLAAEDLGAEQDQEDWEADPKGPMCSPAVGGSGSGGSAGPQNCPMLQLGGKPWSPETLIPGGNRAVLSIAQFVPERKRAIWRSSLTFQEPLISARRSRHLQWTNLTQESKSPMMIMLKHCRQKSKNGLSSLCSIWNLPQACHSWKFSSQMPSQMPLRICMMQTSRVIRAVILKEQEGRSQNLSQIQLVHKWIWAQMQQQRLWANSLRMQKGDISRRWADRTISRMRRASTFCQLAVLSLQEPSRQRCSSKMKPWGNSSEYPVGSPKWLLMSSSRGSPMQMPFTGGATSVQSRQWPWPSPIETRASSSNSISCPSLLSCSLTSATDAESAGKTKLADQWGPTKRCLSCPVMSSADMLQKEAFSRTCETD